MTADRAALADRTEDVAARLSELEVRESEIEQRHVDAIVAGDRKAEKAERIKLAAVRTEASTLAEAEDTLRNRLKILENAERRERAARLLPELVARRGKMASELAKRWGESGFETALSNMDAEIDSIREQPSRIVLVDAEIAALAAAWDFPAPAAEPLPEFDLHACGDAVLEFKASLDRTPFRADPFQLLDAAILGREGALERLRTLFSDEAAELLEGRFETVSR